MVLGEEIGFVVSAALLDFVLNEKRTEFADDSEISGKSTIIKGVERIWRLS